MVGSRVGSGPGNRRWGESFVSRRLAPLTLLTLFLFGGAEYDPQVATEQIFRDVPLEDEIGNRHWAARWIEQAYRDGLVQACQTDMAQMLYRPDDPITRAEAACMLYYALQAGSQLP